MSVDARQELDLKIGVAFSRLMTRTYLDMAREKFRLKDQKVISYGPCQTPTLWFCVQRHKEIQNFRPQQYFYVTLQINVMGRGCVEFLWADGDRVESRQEMEAMESAVRSACQSGAGAVVCGPIEEEVKTVLRPVGLNTVQLLKACSKGTNSSPSLGLSDIVRSAKNYNQVLKLTMQ